MKPTAQLRRTAALQRGDLAVRVAFTVELLLATLWSCVSASKSDCRGHESIHEGMAYPRPNQIRSPQGFGTLVQV
jgi:hypothetical protein